MDNQNEENFPLSQSVEEQSCKTLLPLMETEDAPFLSQSAVCWQENIDWMYENGLIDEKVDVSDVMRSLNTNRTKKSASRKRTSFGRRIYMKYHYIREDVG